MLDVGWNSAIANGEKNSLQSLFLCNHPSMWTFLDGVNKELSMQTASFYQGVAGSQGAPKKKYVQLKKRVRRAQESYGRADRLTYLQAISHLFRT